MCRPPEKHNFVHEAKASGQAEGFLSRCTECGLQRFSGISQNGKTLVMLTRRPGGKWQEFDAFREFAQEIAV